MSAFSKVVVGLDRSDSAQHALRWAAERVGDGNIYVVHAGSPSPEVPAELNLELIHRRELPPSRALMAAAHDLGADAIVVGPHGSGLGRGLGAVARELLTLSALPVVVVDGVDPPRTVSSPPPVVACVGYGEPADAAANWAAEYAIEQQLPLVLLHAVAYRPIFALDSGSDLFASYFGTAVSIEWARDELEAIARDLKAAHPGLAVSTHVTGSSVIKAVTAAGETAELVVLGKRSEEEFLHSIGTPRLRKLVARTRFPTAVVAPASPRQ